MSFSNPTKSTWSQVANEQAYKEFDSGNFNSETMPILNDPIYGKLIQQISTTQYRMLRITQNWANLGTTLATNNYPGIIREIAMRQRKGMDFPSDRGTRPTHLNCYEIFNDEIDVRYHSSQFRWMYPYTIFDEELRRFSGGNGTTISQLTEMKNLNMISARNMFVDNLKKHALQMLSDSVAFDYPTGIDISNFATLTQSDAIAWLVMVDDLMDRLAFGSAAYNSRGEYMQVSKSSMQLIIPSAWYKNVMRRAFPDMWNTTYFEGILPQNIILLDGFESGEITDVSGNVLVPTWDDHGMNLLNWESGYTISQANPDLQAMIIDPAALGFQDNLNEVLVGQKDIEKLATAVRSHFWTSASITDMVTSINITRE